MMEYEIKIMQTSNCFRIMLLDLNASSAIQGNVEIKLYEKE